MTDNTANIEDPKPQPPVLCPQHQIMLSWGACTPWFRGCQYAELLKPLLETQEDTPGRPIKIPEDIEALPVSRQRKIQMVWQRDGRCITCGRLRKDSAQYCPKHRAMVRERQRARNGNTRRNWGAASYVDMQPKNGRGRKRRNET